MGLLVVVSWGHASVVLLHPLNYGCGCGCGTAGDGLAGLSTIGCIKPFLFVFEWPLLAPLLAPFLSPLTCIPLIFSALESIEPGLDTVDEVDEQDDDEYETSMPAWSGSSSV